MISVACCFYFEQSRRFRPLASVPQLGSVGIVRSVRCHPAVARFADWLLSGQELPLATSHFLSGDTAAR